MTSSLQSRSLTISRKWDHGIPPHLRPVLRAYILGYSSVVAPRLLTLVLQHTKKRSSGANNVTQPTRESFLLSLRRILRAGLEFQRFPTFCAILVGSAKLLEVCTMCDHTTTLFFDAVIFLHQTLTLVSGPPFQIPISICWSVSRPDPAEVCCFWQVDL
jgi:hypothetical protein